MQLFPRNFKWLLLDYRAKNDIYSDIHRCFTPLTIWTSIDMFIVRICRCLLALSPPPTSTVHSDSKSNMAGRKNDRELITLARPNKVPALQARLILILDNVEFHL